jgi:hypothetical protein
MSKKLQSLILHPPKTLSLFPFVIIIVFVGYQYLKTLPPGITSLQITGWSDTPAFQVVGSFWGIAHSPGYPLYTISANVFVRLVNLLVKNYEPARAVSLFSLISALVVLVLIYIAFLQLKVRNTIAVLGVVAISFSPTYWYYATIAEVYLFNTLLIAISLVIYLLWRENVNRALLSKLLGISFGLLLVDHRMGVLWIMAVVISIFFELWSRKKILYTTLKNILFFSIPWLALYLYLPIIPRLVDSNYTRFYAIPTDIFSFLAIIFTREWWGLVQYPAGIYDYWQRQLNVFLLKAKDLYNISIEIVGLIGLFFLPPAIPLASLFYFLFGAIYQVDDLDSMLIPLTLFLILGLGLSLEKIARFLDSHFMPKYRLAGVLLTLLFLIVIIIPSFQAIKEDVNHSLDTVGPDMVDSITILAQDGFPMIFLGEDNTPLATAQYAKAHHRLTNIEPIGIDTFKKQFKGMPQQTVNREVMTFFMNEWEKGKLIFLSSEVLYLQAIPEIKKGLLEKRYVVADTYFPDIKQLLPANGLPTLSRSPDKLLNTQLCDGLILVGYDLRWVKRRSGIYLRIGIIFTRDTPPARPISYQYLQISPSDNVANILSSGDFPVSEISAVPLHNLLVGRFIRGVYELRLNQPPGNIILANEFLHLHLTHAEDSSCDKKVIIPLQ